ncbi:MAG: hypothetical protein H0V84_02190 [Actinobacteria bacterium]|nr:hypothetical protein [Actinomycetota bacterium]
MTATELTPPPRFDLPPGHLELRKHHLVAEIARLRSGATGSGGAGATRLSRPRVALASMGAVVAASALLLLAPWEGGGPSSVDRALAAVGAGPVVHAVTEYSWPQDVVVDLATGAERERVHRHEFWYDERRRQLLHRSVTDGGKPLDYLITGPALSVRLDPSLTGFATRYREALASGDARVVGDATVAGRPAKRIEFVPRPGGAVEEVLVDAETSVPLRFHSTYPGGRRSPDWLVVAIESVPRNPSNFREASSSPRPSTGEVTEGRKISLAEAARALGAPPIWLGPSFAGHVLGSVELSDTTAWLTDGSKVSGVLVRLVYDAVRVSLARGLAGRYGVGFGEDDHPTPPEGSVAVTGNDREGWSGELRYGDFAVMLSAPSKEQVVMAARALTPQR